MKKTRFNAFLIAGALACLPLASCGDDDEDTPVDPNENNPTATTTGPHTVFTTLDGNKVSVSKIGSRQFKYDAENYAIDINGAKVNYASGKIVYNNGGVAIFKLNNLGYISELKYENGDDNESYKHSNIINWVFTYDGAGQLTKFTTTATTSNIDKYSGKENNTTVNEACNLFWKNGAITSATRETTTKVQDENGQTNISNAKYEYSVNLGDKGNMLKQNTVAYSQWFNYSLCQDLSLVGLLGAPLATMPQSVIYTVSGLDANGNSINQAGSYELSCTIDNSGKIQTESIDNNSNIYYYNNLSLND